MSSGKIRIRNKKASYQYLLFDKYIAGIQLQGTEIKSIRAGNASLTEAFCVFENGELFILNMHIAEYEFGTYNNHEPKRKRKLLLQKKELAKISKKVVEKGFSLIPTVMFINESGLAKVEIAIGKGKKLHDKRDSIKSKDIEREMGRKVKL